MAFDWSAVDAVVEKIPAGRWASYGAVARAAGLPAQYAKALGAYLADADLEGVWRVLDGDGRPELQRAGDVAEVIEWLKQEGVRFDHLGRARSHCQLDVFQLRRLLKD
jgi:alkylated DNA nucleotide flippase Atl1